MFFHHSWISKNACSQSDLTLSITTPHFQPLSVSTIFEPKVLEKKNPTLQMLTKYYIHLTNGFQRSGMSAEFCILVKIHLKMDKY